MAATLANRLLSCVVAAAASSLVGTANTVPTWPGGMALNLTDSKADMTFSGPLGSWFAVGFGSAMVNTYAIVVNADGSVHEQKLGFHKAGHALERSLEVVSTEVEDGMRKVRVTRDLLGATKEHYSFDLSKRRIPLIFAGSRTKSEMAMHDYKGWTSIPLEPEREPETSCCSAKHFLPCGWGIHRHPVRVTTSSGKFCCPTLGFWFDPCTTPAPTPTPKPTPAPTPSPTPAPPPSGTTWVCSVCTHVYDAAHDSWPMTAGTDFEDLPEKWTCPICGVPKGKYKKQLNVEEVFAI